MSDSKEGDGGETPSIEKAPDDKSHDITGELEKEFELERARADDYLRRLQYLQAEFDNYRKRVEREKAEASRAAADRLLVNLLEVFDEMSIAIEVAKKSDDKETIVSGLEMVLRKLEALFASEGMKPIEAVGKEFDPNLHEVVEWVDSDESEGRVTGEVRKGFMLRGKVIRSSLVKVGAARKATKDGESEGV
jgi:molecular chaperone GrpE